MSQWLKTSGSSLRESKLISQQLHDNSHLSVNQGLGLVTSYTCITHEARISMHIKINYYVDSGEPSPR